MKRLLLTSKYSSMYRAITIGGMRSIRVAPRVRATAKGRLMFARYRERARSVTGPFWGWS